MVMTKLRFLETKDNYYLFQIEIKTSVLFGLFSKTQVFDCFKTIGSDLNRFQHNGDCIYNKFLYLDNSINAILSGSNKNYN